MWHEIGVPWVRKWSSDPPLPLEGQEKELSAIDNRGEEGPRTVWAFPLLLTGIGSTLVWWSWGTWIDPVVDSGRELYVAWRLSDGDLLYRDVAYFNGPLSPHWNALLFRLFGPGIRVLTLANMGIAAGILGLLYGILRRIRGRATAFLGCLPILVLVAFTPRTTEGAYTFVAPYSHELTHGLLLLLCVVYSLIRHEESGRRIWLFAAGLAAGAVALTKPEMGLAVVLVLGGWVFHLARGPKPWTWSPVAGVLSAAMVPPLAAWALLSPHMPPWGVLEVLATPFVSALNGDVRDLLYYRVVMGTAAPANSVRSIILGSLAYSGIIGAPFLVLWRLPRKRELRWNWVWASLGVLSGFAAVLTPLLWIHWWRLFSPLQVTLLVIVTGEISGGLPLLSSGREPEARLPALLLGVAAMSLLAKVFMNTSLVSYGFVLAAPAVVVLTTVVVGTLPEMMAKRNGALGRVFRVYALSLLAAVTLTHFVPSEQIVNGRQFLLGSGSDRFSTEVHRGRVFQELLGRVGQAPGTDRLAVIPEGAMLNYLSRRPSAVPFPTLLPLEHALFGEETILRAFQEEPPELIATWDRERVLYGVFGEDYGKDLASWIQGRYDTTWTGSLASAFDDPAGPDTITVRLLRFVGSR